MKADGEGADIDFDHRAAGRDLRRQHHFRFSAPSLPVVDAIRHSDPHCLRDCLHDPIIVGQCAHRFLVLPDARCGQSFHRADDGLEVAGTADFSH